MAEMAARREAEYRPLFEDLGLSYDQIGHLVDRLNEIHKTAVPADETVKELQKIKNDVIAEINKILPPDKFEEYKHFELQRPYKHELALLQDHLLKASNVKIDADTSQTIIAMLQKHNIATSERWDGPYDPNPRSVLGAELVAKDIQKRMSALNNSIESFTKEESSLSPAVYNGILSYLASKLVSFQEEYDFYSKDYDATINAIHDRGVIEKPKPPR